MYVGGSSGMESREGREVKGRAGDGEMGRWLERRKGGMRAGRQCLELMNNGGSISP